MAGKITEKQEKGTLFCACKNSCQRKTGPKRAGCPCRDEGLYCSEECKCGTNVIVCRNDEHGRHTNRLRLQRKSSSEDDLIPKMDNLQVIDESDDISSDEEKPRNQRRPSQTFAKVTTDDVLQDTPNFPAKDLNGEGKSATQDTKNLPKMRMEKGYALVIHNRLFSNLRKREGSEKDLDAIKLFCKEAGLKIDIREDQNCSDIDELCRELAEDKNCFRNYDGFVCFILSHGNSSGICGSDGPTISVKTIVNYFQKSQHLLGKPKLFFIQACRRGSSVEDDAGYETKQTVPVLCPPKSSDILIAHSTIEGSLSCRDIYRGTWFIQTLIKQLNAQARRTMHLMDIMTVVNKDMAESELEGRRQMPNQYSTLTKAVYFNMVPSRHSV